MQEYDPLADYVGMSGDLAAAVQTSSLQACLHGRLHRRAATGASGAGYVEMRIVQLAVVQLLRWQQPLAN